MCAYTCVCHTIVLCVVRYVCEECGIRCKKPLGRVCVCARTCVCVCVRARVCVLYENSRVVCVGRYVCEECGIRCKKPSMLKKHIRTHTNLRPWTCKHCAFSFKVSSAAATGWRHCETAHTVTCGRVT